MKKYSVFSLRFEKGKEVQNPDFRSFEMYSDALIFFYSLVGEYTFSLHDCSSSVCLITDPTHLKKISLSNSVLSYSIYLSENL